MSCQASRRINELSIREMRDREDRDSCHNQQGLFKGASSFALATIVIRSFYQHRTEPVRLPNTSQNNKTQCAPHNNITPIWGCEVAHVR